MDYLFEMIVKKPECEETILSDLINKLGDLYQKYQIMLYNY